MPKHKIYTADDIATLRHTFGLNWDELKNRTHLPISTLKVLANQGRARPATDTSGKDSEDPLLQMVADGRVSEAVKMLYQEGMTAPNRIAGRLHIAFDAIQTILAEAGLQEQPAPNETDEQAVVVNWTEPHQQTVVLRATAPQSFGNPPAAIAVVAESEPEEPQPPDAFTDWKPVVPVRAPYRHFPSKLDRDAVVLEAMELADRGHDWYTVRAMLAEKYSLPAVLISPILDSHADQLPWWPDAATRKQQGRVLGSLRSARARQAAKAARRQSEPEQHAATQEAPPMTALAKPVLSQPAADTEPRAGAPLVLTSHIPPVTCTVRQFMTILSRLDAAATLTLTEPVEVRTAIVLDTDTPA